MFCEKELSTSLHRMGLQKFSKLTNCVNETTKDVSKLGLVSQCMVSAICSEVSKPTCFFGS